MKHLEDSHSKCLYRCYCDVSKRRCVIFESSAFHGARDYHTCRSLLTLGIHCN